MTGKLHWVKFRLGNVRKTKSQRVDCWAVFKNTNLRQECQAELVLFGWFHNTPLNLQLMFWLCLTENNWAWADMNNEWLEERRACVCIGMTPFIKEDVLCIHGSYLQTKLRLEVFFLCEDRMAVASISDSLSVLWVYHSSTFKLLFGRKRVVRKGDITFLSYWNILHFTRIRKKLSQVHLEMLTSLLAPWEKGRSLTTWQLQRPLCLSKTK